MRVVGGMRMRARMDERLGDLKRVGEWRLDAYSGSKQSTHWMMRTRLCDW